MYVDVGRIQPETNGSAPERQHLTAKRTFLRGFLSPLEYQLRPALPFVSRLLGDNKQLGRNTIAELATFYVVYKLIFICVALTFLLSTLRHLSVALKKIKLALVGRKEAVLSSSGLCKVSRCPPIYTTVVTNTTNDEIVVVTVSRVLLILFV